MDIEPLRAFEDNYIWLITRDDTDACAVVDPGDEEPVISVLEKRDLRLTSILVTHKHYDHTGGIDALKKRYPGVEVFGPGNESISQISRSVEDHQQISLPGMNLDFEVLSIPGHTEGHVAYLGNGVLFCGDTLFAGGCGRVFTGTFEQMSASLDRIRKLPPETQLYCAHEYTQANVGFGLWVEPQSEVLKQRQQSVEAAVEQAIPTVPSSLQQELDTNPFLRVEQQNVISAAEQWAGRPLNNNAEVFTALRRWKDRDYD
ncbi:MAG: hydroxyacylglutathione hydrolase [Gammaproteobacteria bacterium]|nr:hydroxyacylglutathione hydrolase [Gammaproteobacteria bacterium]